MGFLFLPLILLIGSDIVQCSHLASRDDFSANSMSRSEMTTFSRQMVSLPRLSTVDSTRILSLE
jgi:hypothetical protein